MKVGYLQFHPEFGEIEKNCQTIISTLNDLEAGTELIVLPELAFTGYYFQDRAELSQLAEDPYDSESIQCLIDLCCKKNLFVVTGFAERCGDNIYNSSILIGPDGVRHIYRKLHLFNEEKNIFDRGDIALSVQVINGIKIGMMVCFDWAFPEVARSLAIQGAEIICHPSNLVLSFCQEAMTTRCLENRVFAITTNRYGADQRPHGEIKFTGKSQIVTPSGEIIQRAGPQDNKLFVTEIDPTEARNKSITQLNDLLFDRRPDCYDALM